MSFRPRTSRFLSLTAGATAGLTLALSNTFVATAATPAPMSSTAHKQAQLTARDAWVKAAASGMTAAFVTLTNTGTKPITVVAARTPYSATQIHEVVMADGQMTMQQKPGGITIAPGASASLKPGGDHVMLMRLRKAIRPGSLIPFTFVTSDGATLQTKALAKTYTGANETYDASSGMSMNHG